MKFHLAVVSFAACDITSVIHSVLVYVKYIQNSDDIKIIHAHITIEKCNKISSRAYFFLTRAITLFRVSISFGLIEVFKHFHKYDKGIILHSFQPELRTHRRHGYQIYVRKARDGYKKFNRTPSIIEFHGNGICFRGGSR